MMKKDLRIVFMGTPEFAVDSLKALLDNNFNVVGVVTVPDKPAGRGQKLQMSAVKKFALSQNLKILQPKNLKSKSFQKQLQKLNHNLQVVVAFRILPEIIFSMPEYGSFNLHASLLPNYRGAAPINWTVINGEKESGVTTFFLKKKVDTGNIILQKKVTITEDDTAGNLHDKLMKKGARLVVKTCKVIQAGKVKEIEQTSDEKEVKVAPKIFREDCEIDWNQPVETIYNFIRGLSPYPAAWTFLEGKSFKIFTADKEYENHSFSAGQIKSDGKEYLKFAVKDGWILAKKVQLEGKRRMNIDEFLRGFQFSNQIR